MITYLSVWFFFALQGLSKYKSWSKTTLTCLIIFFTLFIGLRFNVGGDWKNYLIDMQIKAGLDFPNLLSDGRGVEYFLGSSGIYNDFKIREPFWHILIWIGANWGGGIYLANVTAAFIFSSCLLYFCKQQRNPWLALIVAFPYLIIVVGMGYTRHSVALGFEMIAILMLQKDRLLSYIAWIILGSTFHRTILVLLLLPMLSGKPSIKFTKIVRFILLIGVTYGLYVTVFEPILISWLQGYALMESEGAWVRVLLCLMPASVFLLIKKKFKLSPASTRIWTMMSFGSFICFLGLLVGLPSTMIDRIALYLIPLQVLVGSNLPYTYFLKISPLVWTRLITIFSLLVLVVWLLYSGHSYLWLPYDNLLFRF